MKRVKRQLTETLKIIKLQSYEAARVDVQSALF